MTSGIQLTLILTLCLVPPVVYNQAEQEQEEEEMGPRYINITLLSSQDGNVCPSTEDTETAINELQSQVISIFNEFVTSEQDLFMCGGTSGWRQVAFINMSDTSYDCPDGLELTTYSKRTCGRAHTDGQSCSSSTFSAGGEEYSQVCGRVRGYQYGSTHAFYLFHNFDNMFESAFVDGITLSHGAVGSRQHIWTFAAGLTEAPHPGNPAVLCPCDQTADASPPFVGDDYFCESALDTTWAGQDGILFPSDPLWDGQDCASSSTCCEFNDPPWFSKTLPSPTTDDIELRLCLLHPPIHSDVPIDLVELYVQ